jgi:hypothetical protein
MATAGAFERQIKIATRDLEPAAISALLAKTARQALAEVIGSGEAPESYTRSVNGRVGAPEESVIAPGPIVYAFSYLEEATLYGLQFARARSPVDSGEFKKSWFALVDGSLWNGQSNIMPGAEVLITNDQPYARKIEVGAMKRMRLPPHVAEDTRQAILRRYPGAFRVELKFIVLAGGYVLKGHSRSVAAKTNRRSSAFREGRAVLRSRKDTAAGQQMTYPAVSLMVA